MASKVYPLRVFEGVDASGAAFEDVRTDPVEPGWLWILTSYAAEDETTAFTNLRVGVESGGFFFQSEMQVSPGAGVLFDGDKPFLLSEGDRFVARFTGATAADLLRLYVLGWMIPPDVDLTPALLAELSGSSHLRLVPTTPEAGA